VALLELGAEGYASGAKWDVGLRVTSAGSAPRLRNRDRCDSFDADDAFRRSSNERYSRHLDDGRAQTQPLGRLRPGALSNSDPI